MRMQTLVDKARAAGMVINADLGWVRIRNKSVIVELYHDWKDGKGFYYGLRGDVRIDLANKITTVKRCAEILGIEDSHG